MPSGIYIRKLFTKEHKRNMSLSHIGNKNYLGKKHTEKAKKKMSLWHKGKKFTKETKEKLSQKHKGLNIWLKGKPWSEVRRKAQEKFIPKPKIKPIKINNKEYDPNWHEIRKIIYARDKWICQECNCKCFDKKRKIKGKRIQCHHIDFNDKNNEQDNLITLCASCHGKTNFNKEKWIIYYRNKMGNL
jgi:hypothetical protein